MTRKLLIDGRTRLLEMCSYPIGPAGEMLASDRALLNEYDAAILEFRSTLNIRRRAYELRAAFSRSEEPDTFRWFASLEPTLADHRYAPQAINYEADPQSAAEPALERGRDELLHDYSPWEEEPL